MVTLNQVAHYFCINIKGADSPVLILTHEAAVPFDISTEDSSELTFNFLGSHWNCPKVSWEVGLKPYGSTQDY